LIKHNGEVKMLSAQDIERIMNRLDMIMAEGLTIWKTDFGGSLDCGWQEP